MKIFIITMDDPIQTRSFIKHIIDNKCDSIVGLAMSKGDRLTIGKNRSKVVYLFSLLLIMGLPAFLKNVLVSVFDRMKKKLSKTGLVNNPSILEYAKELGIEVFDIKTPNSKSFQKQLIALKPDIIINQSQSIIKKKLLDIPKIGVINRHNALLPKNRGRLTPFWVLYNGEKTTGVSIHFVTEEIDAGDIIVQEQYSITKRETFNSLVKKNYQIAPKAMLKALEILESGENEFILNDDNMATYNTIPTFKEALNFRLKMTKRVYSRHEGNLSCCHL